jgi:two-component system response regulator BaeR
MSEDTPMVLIVEDEEKIASLLRDYLQDSGFRTHWLGDGGPAVAWIRDNRPDMVLLDVMLPGKDGLSICREVREFSQVPIIMVTARVEELDRLLGLDFGADDYVCKPFSAREVVARVKAILRRANHTSNEDAADYRGLRIEESSFEATVGGQPLDLTPVEFRLLVLLGKRPGRVYSRDHLIEHIYVDGRVVSDRTVDSHVKNLRKKLVVATGEEDWIRSIYGVGYRLD